jgi:hypothetical protein
MLARAARNRDGTYRVAAGRPARKVLGGFRHEGTRTDDRTTSLRTSTGELRALHAWAWTNLTDLRATNTLDAVVSETAATSKHIADVGSTPGMANRPHDWWFGCKHCSSRRCRGTACSFGFALSPWQTIPRRESIDRPLRGRPLR